MRTPRLNPLHPGAVARAASWINHDLPVAAAGAALAAMLAVVAAHLPAAAVLAVVIAVPALMLAFARPMTGLGLALALTPIERVTVGAAGFEFTASDALAVSAAAGWLMSSSANWRSLPMPGPAWGPLVLLLCSFIPSTILAQDPHSALKQFSGWITFFVLFWMVASQADRRDVRVLMTAIAVAGGLAGLLTALAPATDVLGRPSGPFGQPNELGQFVALTIPIQVYLAVRAAGRLRLLSLVCLGLSVYGLAASLSRASWLGLAAAALVLLAWRPFRVGFAVLAVAAALVALTDFNPAPKVFDTSRVVDRIRVPSRSSAEASSLRSTIYSVAPRVIVDHPLGVGAQNFNLVASDYQLSFYPFNTPVTSSAENLVLGLGTEQGVLAIVALVWLGVACFVVVVHLRGSPEREDRELALMIAAVLLSQFLIGMFHYGLHSNAITLATFIVIGCAMALNRMMAS